jgi:hypothetical protein
MDKGQIKAKIEGAAKIETTISATACLSAKLIGRSKN